MSEKAKELLGLIVKAFEKGHNLEIFSNMDEQNIWDAAMKFGTLTISNFVSYTIVQIIKDNLFDYNELDTYVEQETINAVYHYANEHTDDLIAYLMKNYSMERIAHESVRLYL